MWGFMSMPRSAWLPTNGAGRIAGRTVGDELRLVRQALRVGGEVEILLHRVEILDAHRHNPAIEIEHLTIPHHGDGLILFGDGREEAAVVGRGHDDLTVRQQLRRLGSLGPPDHLILDGVQLGEGASHTL